MVTQWWNESYKVNITDMLPKIYCNQVVDCIKYANISL